MQNTIRKNREEKREREREKRFASPHIETHNFFLLFFSAWGLFFVDDVDILRICGPLHTHASPIIKKYI